MDPAASTETPVTGNPGQEREPTEAELEAMFNSGFQDDPQVASPAPAPATAAPAPGPAPAAPAPKADATPAAPAPAPSSESNDPYADLPQDVREKLARIPALEHDVASNRARVAALNRKLEQARSSGAPASAPVSTPAPAPEPIPSVERVRGELPEVAQAIEDAIRARVGAAAAPAAAAPAPEPAPSAPPLKDGGDDDAVTDDERWLNENRPGWGTKFVSTDFQLWLSRQPDDYRARVMSTNKAADLVDAFSKFDAATPAPAPAPAGDGLAERRSARARASVTPSGAPRGPARSKVLTDEDAFAAGYRGENVDVG